MHLKYSDALDIFMNRLPAMEENDETFRANAELFFRACIEVIRFRENEEVCEFCESACLLNRIELGSGCWLGDVRMAIYLARQDFPPHYAYFYQQFVGAAAMAQSYLVNLDWLKEAFGSNFVSFLRT